MPHPEDFSGDPHDFQAIVRTRFQHLPARLLGHRSGPTDRPGAADLGNNLAEINRLGLKLAYTVETHIHADHITSAKKLKEVAGERTLEDFVALMNGLKLAYPKFIDYAVPGNRECGACPPGVPEHLQQYCAQIAESWQG